MVPQVALKIYCGHISVPKLFQLGNSSPANYIYYHPCSPDGFFRSLICKVTEEKDLILIKFVYRVDETIPASSKAV